MRQNKNQADKGQCIPNLHWIESDSFHCHSDSPLFQLWHISQSLPLPSGQRLAVIFVLPTLHINTNILKSKNALMPPPLSLPLLK